MAPRNSRPGVHDDDPPSNLSRPFSAIRPHGARRGPAPSRDEIATGRRRGFEPRGDPKAGRNQSDLEIIGPAQSQRLLEDAGLAGSYSRFARSSPTPGDIDMVGLKRISDALKTDAILQGDVWQIDRPNDGFFHHTVVAELTLRYSLIGLGNGELLWENSATVRKERMKSEDAPRIEDAIPRAQSLVLKDFPTLRQARGPSAASRGASASFGCH
jgi:hypothetical protein